MKQILRYVALSLLLVLATETTLAQQPQFREQHKVKRKETIFGISRMYGITIQELIAANPEMNTPGYELKKGDYINIPWPKSQPQAPQNDQPTASSPAARRSREACGCRCASACHPGGYHAAPS